MSETNELAARVAAFLAVAADFPDAGTVIQARNPAKGTRATLTLGDLRAVAALLPSAADEPVYQYRNEAYDVWTDCDKEAFERVKLSSRCVTRILYSRPAPVAANGLSELADRVASLGEAWGESAFREERDAIVAELRNTPRPASARPSAGADNEDAVDVALAAYNRADFAWTQALDRGDNPTLEPRHRFAMRAAIAEVSAPVAPAADMVLVPREATDEMMDAGAEAAMKAPLDATGRAGYRVCRDAYAAMLAAAQPGAQ